MGVLQNSHLKKQNGDSHEAKLWCLIFCWCLRGGMEGSRDSRWTVADLHNVNRLYWDQSSAGYWPALICLPFLFSPLPFSQPITSLIGSMSLSLQLHTVITARVSCTQHCRNTLTSELPTCSDFHVYEVSGLVGELRWSGGAVPSSSWFGLEILEEKTLRHSLLWDQN